GSGGDEDSGGDRCSSRLARGQDSGKIGAAGLGHAGSSGDNCNLFLSQTYYELTIEDRNGCGERPSVANGSLHPQSRIKVVWSRETVRNDRGFERNYWFASG